MKVNLKKKHKIAGGICLFVAAILAGSFLFKAKSAEPVNEPEAEAVSEKVRRHIDGVLVDPSKANLKPVAVMIENHPDARPQSGISKAKLVWEAPVEGGITRFMAVYDGTEGAMEIGPVRSARPYYLEWAKEMDAVYAHVGGSPEALDKLPLFKIHDLNQFFESQYFWRSGRREAPHNVYTSSDFLTQAVADKKWSESEFDSWQYKDDAAPQDRPRSVPDLVIEFSTPQFQVKWKYDFAQNEYVRYMDGRRHTDIDTDQIKAKNIVVQYARVAIIDSYGRRRVETVDEGRALMALDGKVIDGTWKKIGRESRTRFYDADGKEVVFNAGTTWIEVVPKGAEVVY